MTDLYTERLILRPFVAQDAPSLVTALNDREMCHGLTAVPYPYTPSNAQWFINEGSEDTLAVCTIDNQLVGAMTQGVQLGYWIAKPHWRNGYAYEAAHAVVTDHFTRNETDIHSGYVLDNHASAAVLRKLGFEFYREKMLYIRSRDNEVPAKAMVLTKACWEMIT